MKTAHKVCEKTIEIVLLLILFVFPFSYGNINSKWSGVFSVFVVGLMFLLFAGRTKTVDQKIPGVVFALLFMLVFDFAEKVNFIYQLNIPLEITRQIPLSTVLLAIGMLAYLIEVAIEGKVQIAGDLFARFFLYTCVFLVVLMMLFYPFLYDTYQMKLGQDIQLLNKILKYLMILVLIANYLSGEGKLKRLCLGFVISLSTAVILRVVL